MYERGKQKMWSENRYCCGEDVLISLPRSDGEAEKLVIIFRRIKSVISARSPRFIATKRSNDHLENFSPISHSFYLVLELQAHLDRINDNDKLLQMAPNEEVPAGISRK